MPPQDVGTACGYGSTVPGGGNQALAEALQKIVELEAAGAKLLAARVTLLRGGGGSTGKTAGSVGNKGPSQRQKKGPNSGRKDPARFK